MVYQPRSDEDIREAILSTARELLDGREFVRGFLLERLLSTQATYLAETVEQDVQEVSQSATIVSADGDALTRKCREIGVQRKPAVRATGVVEFSRSTQPASTVTIPRGTLVSTEDANPKRYRTTEKVSIDTTSTSVQANIRAVDGGAEYNVGSNVITVTPERPSGVEQVTNTNPVGDPDVTLTNGDPQTAGVNKESDTELRERALDRADFGDTATFGAVRNTLTNLEDLDSFAVNHNPTASATADGLDPYHTEVIAYGGATKAIILALKDVMSVGDFLRLESVHGTTDTYTTTVDLLDQSYTIPISRPSVSDVDVDVTVSTESNWAGADAVKREVVEYLGGTDADGAFAAGLGVAENAYVGELRNHITDLDGVVAMTNLVIDDNGDGSTDTTTDANGVEYYTVGDAAVVETNVSDGSVTVTRNSI